MLRDPLPGLTRAFVCFATGVAIAGGLVIVPRELRDGGQDTAALVLLLLSIAAAFIVIGLPIGIQILNATLFRNRRVLAWIWFFGRLSHRWVPAAINQAEWDAMHRIPATGQLESNWTCRDCSGTRTIVRDAAGQPWWLMRNLGAPHIAGVLVGPILARVASLGAPARWRLLLRIRLGASEPLGQHDEVLARTQVGAGYPQELPVTFAERRSVGLLQMTGIDVTGAPFIAAWLRPDAREEILDYMRVIGVYAVVGRELITMPRGRDEDVT